MSKDRILIGLAKIVFSVASKVALLSTHEP